MFNLVTSTICIVVLFELVLSVELKSGDNVDEKAATKFLEDYNKEAAAMCQKMLPANWGYDNNRTDANRKTMLQLNKQNSEFNKAKWKIATSFAWKKLFAKTDPIKYRMFKKLAVIGNDILPEEKLERLNKLATAMSDVYNTAKICNESSLCEKPTLAVEPDVVGLMEITKDSKELKRLWKDWRDASGRKVREQYKQYVELEKEAMMLNGFKNQREVLQNKYEAEDIEEQLSKLWQDLRPFYTQLHAYVRRKLMNTYPGEIRPDGPIPAHLLGSVWTQNWSGIFADMKPYPKEPAMEATEMMLEKKMTPHQMAEVTEEFFVALGLLKMTPEFWNNSVFEKPIDREIMCDASAWDFCDCKDVRIMMCARINMEDLVTMHHEMGHAQYNLQYAKQPKIFQDGANSGFHEAVGDSLQFSVVTQKHLKKIGLLQKISEDKEAEINFLMKTALSKIASLPYDYSLDLWRRDILSGKTKPNEMNTKWWEMKNIFQGVCPPVPRTEEDFDPGAKYQVIAAVPSIRYIVSIITQFQFHKALCMESGYLGPLHKCDIYQSKEAGKLLSDMLAKGSSIKWQEAMSIITKGKTNQMEASAILEYFDPLIKWLKTENQNETVGWSNNDPSRCP